MDSTIRPGTTTTPDDPLDSYAAFITAITGYLTLVSGRIPATTSVFDGPISRAVRYVTEQMGRNRPPVVYSRPSGITEVIDLRQFGSSGLSCPAFFESLLPVLLYCDSESHIVVHGTTHPSDGRSLTYFAEVFLPMVRKNCGKALLSMQIQSFAYGDDPTGIAVLHVRPNDFVLDPIRETERSPIVELRLFLGAWGFDPSLLHTTVIHLTEKLESAHLFWPEIEISACQANNNGSVIFLKAEYGNVGAGFERTTLSPDSLLTAATAAADDLIAHDRRSGVLDPELSPLLMSLVAIANLSSTLDPALHKPDVNPMSNILLHRWTTSGLTPATIYLAKTLAQSDLGLSIHVAQTGDGSAQIDIHGGGSHVESSNV